MKQVILENRNKLADAIESLIIAGDTKSKIIVYMNGPWSISMNDSIVHSGKEYQIIDFRNNDIYSARFFRSTMDLKRHILKKINLIESELTAEKKRRQDNRKGGTK